MPRNDRGSSRINSLRIGMRELNALLDRIEGGQKQDAPPDREFVRWSFRIDYAELTIEHDNGSSVMIPVATRNLSRGGISVLHSAYVYPDSRCHIRVIPESGEPLSVRGRVMRCNHIGGKVHEVGIRFDEQISTKDLLDLDPMQGAYSLEAIEPERLLGTVLVLSASDLDRQLVTKFLEDTSLTIDTVTDAEAAVERAQKGVELLLADDHIAGESGAEIISRIRGEGIDAPILVMTADDSNTTRDEMRMAGASGSISKPLNKDRLFQAIAEFLLAEGDAGSIQSTLTPDDDAYELLEKFYTEAPRMAASLEKALNDEDTRACAEICRSLAGAAAPLGFEPIGDLAASACRALAQGEGTRDAAAEIRRLVIACRRIKAKPKQAA